MIQMAVCHKEDLSPHEVPGACSQFKTKLQLLNSPIALDGRSRIAINCESFVANGVEGKIFNHECATIPTV